MSSTSKEFQLRICSLVEERLASIGFTRRRRRNLYRMPLDDEIEGWLGLNTDLGRDAPPMFRINPVIGVDHLGIRSLFNKWFPGRRQLDVGPVISSPLGYLMPANTFNMWDFHPDRDNAVAIDAMVSDVRDYGITFIRSYDTLPKLVEGMQDTRYCPRDHRAFDLPIALLLLGRCDEANQAVHEELKRRRAMPESSYENSRRYIEEYVEFASRIHEYLRPQTGLGPRE